MRALKRLGQNFLVNEEIARDIVESLDINDGDDIIEIGPGRGMLTRFLLKKIKNRDVNIRFIEFDDKMCEILSKNFHNISDKIINKDVLKLNFNDIFKDDKKIKIIGNFPYNISGKLINKIVDNRDVIEEVVGMFQKEVVDRIIAKHNCKDYGFLLYLVNVIMMFISYLMLIQRILIQLLMLYLAFVNLNVMRL